MSEMSGGSTEDVVSGWDNLEFQFQSAWEGYKVEREHEMIEKAREDRENDHQNVRRRLKMGYQDGMTMANDVELIKRSQM
jgi:hypothetical protein